MFGSDNITFLSRSCSASFANTNNAGSGDVSFVASCQEGEVGGVG